MSKSTVAYIISQFRQICQLLINSSSIRHGLTPILLCDILQNAMNHCLYAVIPSVSSKPSSPKTKLGEKIMKQKNVVYLVHSAAIAALYVVLTMLVAPIAFGPIQFRFSEALTILPFFTSAAIPGLFVGCLLSNLIGGAIIWDVLFGSLATLLGALGTYLLRRHRKFLCLPPIISNTLIIPFVLRYAYGEAALIPYLMLTIGIGEILSVGVCGNLLLETLMPYREILFKKTNQI